MSNKISVIVPVYNVEPYLNKCINSILDQTYKNLELILIDDGSTDRSGLICEEYKKRDPRIIVIHQSNMGVSSARNAGLNICSGSYVSFVDSDDWIEKNMYQDMISAIEDTGTDFAVCNETLIYSSNSVVKSRKRSHWADLKENCVVNVDGVYRKIYSCTGILCNKVLKKRLLGDKRFDTSKSYGEDFDFFLKILENVNSAVIVPSNYYNYNYVRTGNVLSATINEKSLELLKNAEKAYVECAKRGYGDVGISRIYIAVNEVIGKFPKQKWYKAQYQQYIDACKKAAKVPIQRDVIAYLDSNIVPTKNKWSYLLMRTNFLIWLAFKKSAFSMKRKGHNS